MDGMVAFGVSVKTVAAGLLWALRMNKAGPIAIAGALVLVLGEAVWLHTLRKPIVPVAQPITSGLALKVQREGRSLRLSWDQNSESVRHASHAILHIADGTHNTHLDLNIGEIHAGRLVYWPETDNVTFRMEADASGERNAQTVQAPSSPIQTVKHNEEPAERKPSPFALARADKVQPVSVQVVPDRTPDPGVQPATPPAGSFFGRLFHKIPGLRRLDKSSHLPTASSD
jgi:hypothetical protein